MSSQRGSNCASTCARGSPSRSTLGSRPSGASRRWSTAPIPRRALRGKSKYHEIHVKEGNCYIGHRIAVFNPWGKNNITILCLDKDYGFHSTASGVARGRGYGRGEGQWDNPKCMEGDNQRFIQLAHQNRARLPR